MSDGFIYDEIGRNHTLNGIPLPSVTQIIKPLTNFDGIPPHVLERKKQLGLNFHKATELHMLDDLCMDSLDPDLIKPMETFIEWWKLEYKANKFLFSERPLCHLSLKYCGKPDLVMEKGIYDIKLRLYNPVSDPIQMEGYKHLCHREPNRFKPLFTKVICFDIKGGIKIHDARNSQAWHVFVAMLTHYKLLEEWKNHQKGS